MNFLEFQNTHQTAAKPSTRKRTVNFLTVLGVALIVAGSFYLGKANSEAKVSHAATELERSYTFYIHINSVEINKDEQHDFFANSKLYTGESVKITNKRTEKYEILYPKQFAEIILQGKVGDDFELCVDNNKDAWEKHLNGCASLALDYTKLTWSQTVDIYIERRPHRDEDGKYISWKKTYLRPIFKIKYPGQ